MHLLPKDLPMQSSSTNPLGGHLERRQERDQNRMPTGIMYDNKGCVQGPGHQLG